jgi:flagellar hook-length control protein FliK
VGGQALAGSQAGAGNGAGADTGSGSGEDTGQTGAGVATQAESATSTSATPAAADQAPTPAGAAAGAAEASQLSGAVVGTQAQASTASAAATPSSGVGLHEMIESIHATIEIAARQGATQARISLQPEALGQISIRLSQTSEGLLARVSAETPAAAQALADARAELHQSLSSLGVSLLRLDIGSGQSETGNREGRFAGDPQSSSASSAASNPEEVESPETLGEPEAPAQSPSIAGGALVDVLA